MEQVLCWLFKPKQSLILLLILCSQIGVAQFDQLGTWKAHFDFGNHSKLSIGDKKAYGFAGQNLYSYDLQNFFFNPLTRVDGLTGIGFTSIYFDQESGSLLIGYQDGKLDIISNEGMIRSYADIQITQTNANKAISNISVTDGIAYLATGFGIVAIQLESLNTIDTYKIGNNGNDIESYSAEFFSDIALIHSKNGLYLIDRTLNQNLADFSNWEKVFNQINQILIVDNESLLINQKNYILQYHISSRNTDTLYKFTDTTTLIDFTIQNQNVYWLSSISGKFDLQRFSLNNGDVETLQNDLFLSDPISLRVSPDEATILISDFIFGLYVYNEEKEIDEFQYPSGPFSDVITDLYIPAANKLWTTHGELFGTWLPTEGKSGFSYSYELGWENYNPFNYPERLDSCWDVLAIHEDETGLLWLGSWVNGIYTFNRETKEVNNYNKNNSNIQFPVGSVTISPISDIIQDKNNTIWLVNSTVSEPLIAIPSDKRNKPKEWINFSIDGGREYREAIVDRNGWIWLIGLQRDGASSGEGIAVFDYGESLEDKSDDRAYRFKATGTADGLPTNDAKAIAEDLDGEIWVGTSQGIVIYSCSESVFEGACPPRRIIVEIEGYNGYLLENEVVKAIAVDAGNRKWIGTNSGVFVMSPDGKILEERYNTENSPLPSDIIKEIAIDEETGRVYIATELGMLSLQTEILDLIEEEITSEDIFAYPNPFRISDGGFIQFTGLPPNSTVKIITESGHLIHQFKGIGNRAKWDTKDETGQQVPTGAYIAYAFDPESGAFSEMPFVILP